MNEKPDRTPAETLNLIITMRYGRNRCVWLELGQFKFIEKKKNMTGKTSRSES